MSTEEASRFVRVRVELVLEVEDETAVTGAALVRVASDPGMPAAERVHAERAVTEDTAEALAQLIGPFDLVNGVPGVELRQSSWSCERIGHDPDSPEWDLDGDDGPGGDEDDAAG